ncbi:MAG: gliding motility lipoprotein GldH [Saprospiraceae bacterium]
MNIKSSIEVVSFAFLFIIILTSCGDNKSYIANETNEFENAIWNEGDTLTFKADISDMTKRYNLGMTLKHNKDYTYQNVYLMIHTTFPDGKRFSKQVNIDIADKTGKWYSDCSGNTCKVEIDIQKEAIFNQAGEYTFTVEQFTRDKQLGNIQSLAFYIEDTGKLR